MTPAVFSALGVTPLMGRIFTAQEDEQKQQLAVLSSRRATSVNPVKALRGE
jgi:hypothetical protein